MTMPPGVLDQYFLMSGDTVQNVEISCIKCPPQDRPMIYLNTYQDGHAPFSNQPDVQVVQSISGMLEAMHAHVQHVHLEEVR